MSTILILWVGWQEVRCRSRERKQNKFYHFVPLSTPGRRQNTRQDQLGGSPGTDARENEEELRAHVFTLVSIRKEGRGRVSPPNIGYFELFWDTLWLRGSLLVCYLSLGQWGQEYSG